MHTQRILAAAPASDRYRSDSLRSMCFVACLSRKKTFVATKMILVAAPANETCHAHSFAKREKAVIEDWRFCCHFALKAGWFTEGVSSCVFFSCVFFVFFFFSEIWNIRSLTGYDKTYTMNPCFVFRDSRLRPIVYSYKLSLWLTAYSDLLFIIISCLYGWQPTQTYCV